MKKALLGLALLSSVVLASPVKPATRHETKTQERFEHVKARIIHMIDREMGFLQRHKACVERAQNWKELRACKPHRKVWHKPMKKIEKK